MNLTEIYNNYILWKSVEHIKIAERIYKRNGKRGVVGAAMLEMMFTNILGSPETIASSKKHFITIKFKNNITCELAKQLNLEYDELNFQFKYYGVESLFSVKDASITWVHYDDNCLCIEMVATEIDIKPMMEMIRYELSFTI